MRLSQLRPPALDVAFALPVAGLAGDRCQAAQTGDALGVQAAKLGHVDQHGKRRNASQAWDAEQDVEAGLETVLFRHQR